MARYINVDVDIDDVFAAIDDADIIKEAASRGYNHSSTLSVIDALTQMRAGRIADAQTTLEREFLPKWRDRAECEASYRLAIVGNRQAVAA